MDAGQTHHCLRPTTLHMYDTDGESLDSIVLSEATRLMQAAQSET